MTLTPDRQHPGDDSRSAGSRRGGKPAKGVGGNSAKNAHRGSASGQSSLFDQLRDAGFDLTGHSLADRFDEIPGVPGVSDCD
ncbi:HNH endonuclease, partial [Geobacillus sp. MMMUD3]|nr:HNH endonuclease [Geobacillus sp. MMMUD3]